MALWKVGTIFAWQRPSLTLISFCCSKALVIFSLLFRRLCTRLVALSGSYVDEFFQSSTLDQKKSIEDIFAKELDIKLPDEERFTYLGMDCDISEKTESRLSQAQYIKKIHFLPTDASLTDLRSVCANFSWVVLWRPEIAYALSFSAPITKYTYIKEKNRKVSSIIRYLNKKINSKPRLCEARSEITPLSCLRWLITTKIILMVMLKLFLSYYWMMPLIATKLFFFLHIIVDLSLDPVWVERLFHLLMVPSLHSWLDIIWKEFLAKSSAY